MCIELDLLPIAYDGTLERLEDVIKILIYSSRIIAMDLVFNRLSEAERRCLHLSYLHFWAHLRSRPKHAFPALDCVFYLRDNDNSDLLERLAIFVGEFGLSVLHRTHLDNAWTDIDLAEHIDGYFNLMNRLFLIEEHSESTNHCMYMFDATWIIRTLQSVNKTHFQDFMACETQQFAQFVNELFLPLLDYLYYATHVRNSDHVLKRVLFELRRVDALH